MNWRQTSVVGTASLQQALEILDKTTSQIVIVLGEDDVLAGTLTDGDIRRALLSGASLESIVSEHMNCNPIIASSNTQDLELLNLMQRLSIRCVPLVNAENQVVGLRFLDKLELYTKKSTPVVIMAGGRGERLKPLTDFTPKSLLTIAGQPLIEVLINRLANQGFYRIWIAVHYRAESIIEYLGNGNRFGVEIQYLHEEFPLGTAGALGLLPKLEGEKFIILCNSDLINDADFSAIITNHEDSSATATIVVADHSTQIPYGVAHVENGNLIKLEEKPIRNDLISAGINVFNSTVIEAIPKNQRIDIPEIYSVLLADKKQVSVYKLDGYWLDVGTHILINKAHRDHSL